MTPVRIPRVLYLTVPGLLKRFQALLADFQPPRFALDVGALTGVDVAYSEDTDTGLLTLRLDRLQVTPTLLGLLGEDARNAGMTVVDPTNFPAREKLEFFTEYLPLFKSLLTGVPTPEDAIRFLGRHLGVDAGDNRPSMASRDEWIEVRFRRGADWQLGYIRGLSRSGLYIATGCTVKTGDTIDVELSVRACQRARAHDVLRVVLPATVFEQTPTETAETLGLAGFIAHFVLATSAEEQQLARILEYAQGMHAIGLSPPCRRDVRYPIRWTVMLSHGGTTASCQVLDISRRGMFIGTNDLFAPGALIEVCIPLDGEVASIRASARVARVVTAEMSVLRGVAMGMGVELVAFSLACHHGEQRFHQFVERIAKRVHRSVLVCASAARAFDLTEPLAGAGYQVTAVSDPLALATELTDRSHPHNLLVLDSALDLDRLRPLDACRVTSALKRVPALRPLDDSPQGLLHAVDSAIL